MSDDILKMNLVDEAARDEFLSAMDEFLKSRGWKYMKGYFQGRQQQVLENVASNSMPNELLRESGKLVELKEMMAWPEVMAKLALAKKAEDKKKREIEDKMPKYPSAPNRR